MLGLGITVGLLYAFAVLGIAVRVWKAGRGLPRSKARRARFQTFNQIGLGLGITMLGAVGALWSYRLAEPGFIFLIPTGVILPGLVQMGSAMGCGGEDEEA